MNKQLWLALVLVFLFSLVLVSCGGGSGGAEQASKDGETSVEEAKTDAGKSADKTAPSDKRAWEENEPGGSEKVDTDEEEDMGNRPKADPQDKMDKGEKVEEPSKHEKGSKGKY